MSVSVANITLFSRNPQDLAHFFSELLDLDILPIVGGEGIKVHSEKVTIRVLKANADQLFHKAGDRDVMIEFSLPSQQDLEDLLHKVQFLSYRQNSEKPVPRAKLSKIGDEVFFFLKDPDGRSWKFSFSGDIS
jgi:catechol-2,3-dioxygenase